MLRPYLIMDAGLEKREDCKEIVGYGKIYRTKVQILQG